MSLPGQMDFTKVPGFERRPASAAKKPENSRSLSTVKGHQNSSGLSIVKGAENSSGLSIVGASQNSSGLSIEDIDRRRRRLGISVERLIGEARVTYFTWRHAMKGDMVTRSSTLARLDRALARLNAGERQQTEGALTRSYRHMVGLIAEWSGVDVAGAQAIAFDFSKEKPSSPDWIAAARVRRLAMYVLAAAGERKADVARAIGCTRQNVMQAVSAIEALRASDAFVDTLLDRLDALRGGA